MAGRTLLSRPSPWSSCSRCWGLQGWPVVSERDRCRRRFVFLDTSRSSRRSGLARRSQQILYATVASPRDHARPRRRGLSSARARRADLLSGAILSASRNSAILVARVWRGLHPIRCRANAALGTSHRAVPLDRQLDHRSSRCLAGAFGLTIPGGGLVLYSATMGSRRGDLRGRGPAARLVLEVATHHVRCCVRRRSISRSTRSRVQLSSGSTQTNGGGPNNATITIVQLIYSTASSSGAMGSRARGADCAFVMALVVAVVQFRSLRSMRVFRRRRPVSLLLVAGGYRCSPLLALSDALSPDRRRSGPPEIVPRELTTGTTCGIFERRRRAMLTTPVSGRDPACPTPV